jgi:hypothetical protein
MIEGIGLKPKAGFSIELIDKDFTSNPDILNDQTSYSLYLKR